jgi:hypothetical protein
MRLLRCLVVSAFCISVSCADANDGAAGGSGPTGASDAPIHVDLTCGVDGSTSLSSGVVQPQRDGVHLLVVNEYDEPVSVEGFDADPGSSDWVLAQAPGNVELMCWPFSLHSSGEEPLRVRLTVVDPQGLYVDGTLACEMVTSMHGDYADLPVDEGPPPLDVAREAIGGLRPDDLLLYAGYPDQLRRAVVVSREDEIVASFSIARFQGQSWEVTGYSACEGSDLPSLAG